MKFLKLFSDQELVGRLRALVRQEQNLTLELLPFLAEVGTRGLYLAKGYGTLYEYCKNELGYSDASAWRRVRAALAIQRCPEAYELLVQGRVTMCALGRIYKFVSPAILEKIRDKSQAEVEMIAAVLDAKGAAPDRTRPIMVPKTVTASRADGSDTTTVPDTGRAGSFRLRSEVKGVNGSDSPGNSLRCEVSAADERVTFEKKWKVEGVVSSRIKEKLDRCKSLLSNKYPDGVTYEALFDELTEIFLDRKDPKRRQERREKRQSKITPKAAARSANPRAGKTGADSRYIPRPVRDRVWSRDGGRCSFVGIDGTRCDSTRNLQFDHHPLPFGRGGPSTADNLRLLCARHNRYTAARVYGKMYMEQFRAARE